MIQRIKWSEVPDTAPVYKLSMEDYFGGEEFPYTVFFPSKKDFEKEYLYEDETFDEWFGSSGDGQANYCLLTVDKENKVAVVIPG